jgi:hypothetical protein
MPRRRDQGLSERVQYMGFGSSTVSVIIWSKYPDRNRSCGMSLYFSVIGCVVCSALTYLAIRDHLWDQTATPTLAGTSKANPRPDTEVGSLLRPSHWLYISSSSVCDDSNRNPSLLRAYHGGPFGTNAELVLLAAASGA